ncbi:hypothetical protein QBC43DRAFT_325318 [Cladorrhinum sp. PSN259]|nr:hypothetical protein QBC43DRAFT_325318 [Cladorrhinum sp. PSN259]
MRDRSKSYVTRFRTLSRILRHNMVAWWVLTKFYDYQVLRDVEYLSQDVYLEFLDVISWIEWIEEDGVTGNRKKMVKQAWARGMEYLGKFENDEQYMDVEQAVEILPVGEGWAEGLTIEEVKKEELKPKLESRITEWDAMVRERVGELVIKPWSLLGSSNGHITSRFAPIEREEEEDESEQYDDSSDTVTEVCSDWEGKTEGECKEEFEVYEENGKGKSSAKGVLEVQFEAQDKLRAQQVSKILVEQQRQTFSVPGKVASAEEQR